MFGVCDSAAETLRHMKLHFNSPDALAALQLSRGGRRGGKRGQQCLREEVLREDRERRKLLMKCGFFSSVCQPYKPVGRMYLDIRELVCKQLGLERMVKKASTYKTKNLARMRTRYNSMLEKAYESDQLQANNERRTAYQESDSHDHCVHESERLRGMVDESERRVLAERTGRTWMGCVREYEQQMELQQVGVVTTEWRRFPYPRKLKAISMLVSRFGTGSGSGVNGLIDEMEDLAMAADEERQKAWKIQNEFVRRVQAIYMIVCCVLNMKQRDLRTRIPLKPVSLKHLQRDVLLMTASQVRPSSTVWPPPSAVCSLGQAVDTGSAKESPQGTEKEASSVGYLVPGNGPSKQVPPMSTMMSQKSFKIRTNISPKPKVDPWGELLSTLEVSGHSPLLSNSHKAASRSWYPNSNRDAFTTAKRSRENENLPLWQKLLLFPPEEDEKGTNSKTTDMRRVSEEDDDEKPSARQRLFMLRRNFNDAVKKSESHLQMQLDRYEREARELYNLKCEKLATASPWNMALSIAAIRAEAHSELIHKQRTCSENQNKRKTSKWVATLEKELSIVFESKIMCEGSEERQTTVLAVLKKLKAIPQEQLADIQHVKAKLCLLFYSLPPMQVCSKPVCDAFQFCIQRLFGCNESLYKEWMKTRKLPFPLPVRYNS